VCRSDDGVGEKATTGADLSPVREFGCSDGSDSMSDLHRSDVGSAISSLMKEFFLDASIVKLGMINTLIGFDELYDDFGDEKVFFQTMFEDAFTISKFALFVGICFLQSCHEIDTSDLKNNISRFCTVGSDILDRSCSDGTWDSD
jgi:hypothetical protein